MRVAGVVHVRLVRKGAPSGSLGLFVFVWFVRVRPGGYWVSSGLPSSLGCTLGIAGYLHVRLVRLGAPFVSLGSFVLV